MDRISSFLFPGWGRKAAWAALVLVIAVEVFARNLFPAPRLALFDSYERSFPRLVHGHPVVIVAVDNTSLKRFGQWPWPRQLEAQLIAKVLSAHPAAMGLDLIEPEADRSSPEEWVKMAGDMPAPLRAAVGALPSHDALLAQAIGSGPVALGIGGLRLEKPIPDEGPLAPFRVIGATGWSPPKSLPTFNAAERWIPVIDSAAAGHGVLSADQDSDGLIRRMPLVAAIGTRLAPSLSAELIRLAAHALWFDLDVAGGSIRGLTVGPLNLPAEPDGSLWVHFSPHDDGRFVSAADVLAGAIPESRFEQRIVLFSASALGVNDTRETPVGLMSGTEIHAQLIENMVEDTFAVRPAWTAWIEPLITLAFALLLIVTLALLRPRSQPLAVLVVITTLLGVGYLIWWQGLLLIDVATPAMSEAFIGVALMAGNFAEADLQRRRLRRELEERKLAEARAHGEREAGRRIQMGMLPLVSSIADSRIDLDALMVPARDIGGDLYDFFKIDNDRLFFAIGDVSGKGLPAALFMALAKSQLRSAALSGETSVSAIMNRVNRELAHVNPEMLFITMFAGILHLDSGLVEFTNAGHDPPWLLRGSAPPHAIPSVGGPPLCTLEDFDYATEKCLIGRNDMLFLLTDGVTEAMTKDGELMGKTRVETALSALARDASAHMAIERVRIGVVRFVAGAEPSDDLTLLVLHLVAAV